MEKIDSDGVNITGVFYEELQELQYIEYVEENDDEYVDNVDIN